LVLLNYEDVNARDGLRRLHNGRQALSKEGRGKLLTQGLLTEGTRQAVVVNLKVGVMLVLQVVVLSLERHIQTLRERLIHQIEALEMKLVPRLHLLVVNHFDDFLVAVEFVLLVAH
jgi:hypothetical protein